MKVGDYVRYISVYNNEIKIIPIKEIPQFKGTLEQLNNLCNLEREVN